MEYQIKTDGSLTMVPENNRDIYILGRIAEKLGGTSTFTQMDELNPEECKVEFEVTLDTLIQGLLFPADKT